MEMEQKSAKAKNKCFFSSSYCVELEAVLRVGLPERNTAGNVGVFLNRI
jgi:hypothetical protein